MNKILQSVTVITVIFLSIPLLADAIDLNRKAIYVRKGFDREWVRDVPAPGDRDWLVIPGISSGSRKVVLKELPLDGIPKRAFFSLKKYPPENFTFLTAFYLKEGDPALNRFLGIYFSNIGENWSVFLNGILMRSEIHVNGKGEITGYRHMREVLIPIDPRMLRAGKNVLAVRIYSDPTNIDSGFHRSTPFIIDTLERLERVRSEQTALILIFLYLFFGIYHLFIFIRRRDELFNLYYALFSILLSVYLLSRTHAIYAIINDSTILHRIEYCSLYALVPLIGAFTDLLLAGTYSRITKIFGAFYAVLIAVTVMPVSNPFAIDVLRVWQITVIIPLLYYPFIRIGYQVYANSKRIYNRYRRRLLPYRIMRTAERTLASTTAGNLLVGTIVLVACAVFDIADSLFWAYDYVLTQYGFFAFTMGITLLLANRFLKTHKELERNNEIATIEMDLAANMQKLLLTPVPVGLDHWDIAMSFQPKYGASGDFYDFYYVRKRLQGIALFDVSGHGISSALITVMVKPVTYRIFNAMQNESLEAIINQVNRHVSSDLSRLDNFVTCILLRINENEIEYVNAGHPDLLARAGRTGAVRTIDAGEKKFRGEPLGLALNHHRPSMIRFAVEKGDILLLYTDCILDARSPHRERFGLPRLMKTLQEAPDGSSREILDFILGKFNAFIKDMELRDDFTVIVAKKTS